MKVLIPSSGGINSTYALWRWLSQTSHEVVSVHLKEKYLSDDKIQAGEDAAVAIKDWLKANVSDFTCLSAISVDSIAEEKLPTRQGGSEVSQGNISILLNRKNKMLTAAKDNSCDGIVVGYSLENTSSDRMWDLREHSSGVIWSGKTFFCSTSDIELDIRSIDPFPSRTDTGTFLENLSGRFEQYEALPSALKDLVHKGFGDDIDMCPQLGAWDAYEKFSGTGAEFDQWLAEKTCAGKWRPNAGADYFYRNNQRKFLRELRNGGYNF